MVVGATGLGAGPAEELRDPRRSGHPERDQRAARVDREVRAGKLDALWSEFRERAGIFAPVQLPVRRQLRHREPCHQARHAGHVRHAAIHVRPEQLAVLDLQSGRAARPVPVRVAAGRRGTPEVGARRVRAGSMDDPELDAELRRAARLSQRVRAGAECARDSVRPGPELPGADQCAELEGYQPAPGRHVRPGQQAQHGAASELGTVRRERVDGNGDGEQSH